MTDPARSARATYERLLPLALVVGVLVVAILTITPWPVGAFEDDAIYTILAKSLATGHGYRLLNLPGAPHATHYPPGYPFFLSLLWRLAPSFPDNIVVFKFANAVLLSLAALGTYAFARRRGGLGRLGASLAALVGTLSIVVLLITGVILSEPMFMALLLPALLVAERAVDDGRTRSAVLAGLLLAAVGLVRTIGLVAIPAAVLVLLRRGRRQGAVALLVAGVVPLIPWQLWVGAYQHEVPEVLQGKYGAYLPWMLAGYRDGGLSFAGHVVAINVQRIELLVGYLVMPVTAAVPRALAFAAAIALCVGGLVTLARRTPVVVTFLAAYVTVVLVWPFEPDRFLLAVWPLLVVGIAHAVVRLWRWSPPVRARVLRLLPLAAAVVVTAGYTTYNARGFRHQWWASVQRDAGRDAKPIVEWVAHHTAMTDVLATQHDLMVFLYTGRQAVPVSGFPASARVTPLSQREVVARARAIIERYHPRLFISAWPPAVEAARTLSSGPHPLLRPAGGTTNADVFEVLAP